MAYHPSTKPSPRYPEHYVSQGKLVTSLSVALGIYTVLSLCLFAAQVWSALVASDVVKLTDDTAEVMFVMGSTIHFLRAGTGRVRHAFHPGIKRGGIQRAQPLWPPASSALAQRALGSERTGE